MLTELGLHTYVTGSNPALTPGCEFNLLSSEIQLHHALSTGNWLPAASSLFYWEDLKRWFLTCMASPARLSLSVNKLFTVKWYMKHFIYWTAVYCFFGFYVCGRSSCVINLNFKSRKIQFWCYLAWMSFMYDVLPKTCLGCVAVGVSLVDVTVLQTSLYADYDTKTQKLRWFQIFLP